MRKSPFVLLLALSALALLGACGSPRVASPNPGPVLIPPPDTTEAVASRRLVLVSGRYTYRFTQATSVQGESENSGALDNGRISTLAQIIADVTQDPDSSFRIAVTVDSLQLRPEGQIRTVPIIPVSLGVVLEASSVGGRIATTTRLPDSLCAYSQFVSLARQLILPKLPNDMVLLNAVADTITLSTCRAGTRIITTVVQELRQHRSSPYEIAFHEQAGLAGTGELGKDSVSIVGSITTEGTAEFEGNLRLPSALKTNSKGSITVQLGNSKAIFRQESTQAITRDAYNPPEN